jgi:phosphoenolpyruvate-protein phosphotransferase/dihydroxyacetone kinase phosphotransfer subunit
VPEPAQPLVGIVVVSHSAKLAAGVVDVAREMAGPAVRLIAAGGTGDGALGTDAVLIAEAVARADAGAGVVILADLGSAVLSAKMAIEMCEPALAARTRLSGGPLVEGAFVAAIQAAAGDSLAEVLWSAREAASFPKDTDEAQPAPEPEPAGPVGPERILEITVRNPMGLHGRPGAELVKIAAQFQSRVLIENLTTESQPANAKSSTKVLAAGVREGHVIRIAARGEDADRAVEAIRSLAEAGFGEGAGAAGVVTEAASPVGGNASSGGVIGAGGRINGRPTPVQTGPVDEPKSGPTEESRSAIVGGTIAGRPGAAGIAIGPIWIYREAAGGSTARPDAFVANAPAVISEAAKEAGRQLHDLAERVRGLGRPDDAEILEAQSVMASDPELLDAAVTRATAGEAPASAIETASVEVGKLLAAQPDELLAARAADVRDVGARIARILRGDQAAFPKVPSIAVADDLPPSIAAEIPPGLLLGIALERGSITAHAVILARGMGIPAIVGARGLVDAGGFATTIAMDGASGEIALDPDPARVADFTGRAEALAARRQAAAALRDRPAATADGERVTLLANIGGPTDSARALEVGAEGVGLFRTEFLFMKRRTAPSETEQVAAYRAVFEAFGPDRPVVVRLADIGGDKALPYLNLPVEANPFLGVRAIRLASAGSRDLLLTQLRAVWRAAGLVGVTPHVMAPMVATLDDAQMLLDLCDEARVVAAATAAAAGEPMPVKMVTGVMVEIPSAAMIAHELAAMVDFFSIGTNDLTQYAMAADRGNASLAALQDALHPAVLRLIREVVAGADAAGIPVAVCGELAGDPVGALVLVGLGVDELSADAGSIDAVRAALATVSAAELADLARRALASRDAEAVRTIVREFVADRERHG